jgi:hypothetical protein
MSRKEFYLISNLPISEILLDTGNPRIRDGSDQADCITRILRKEDHLKSLMADIAKNGLTTAPILVKPHDNKYVVMDGNRRITALKLLNEPNLYPNTQLKNFTTALKQKYANNIISNVDVLASTNIDAIAQEILSRHDGEQGGAGQVNWNAYLRTIFLMNNGHPAEYKRSAQYAMWAENQGILVDEDFPITALNRFFTQHNLKGLGFSVDNDELKANISIEKIKQMAHLLFNDFYTKSAKTDSVRTPELASAYVENIRLRVGLTGSTEDISAPVTSNANQTTGPSTTTSTSTQANTSNEKNSTTSNTTTPPENQGATTTFGTRAAPTPIKPSNDRNRIFGTRSAINLPIPASETKATNIVSELRKIDVKLYPVATAMLLRALIELSDNYYRDKHSIILPNQDGLGKKIIKSAEHMKDSGVLNKDELDMVKRLCSHQNELTLIHIEALQKIIHKDTHNPDYKQLNTFWDNFGVFVRTCWRS